MLKNLDIVTKELEKQNNTNLVIKTEATNAKLKPTLVVTYEDKITVLFDQP